MQNCGLGTPRFYARFENYSVPLPEISDLRFDQPPFLIDYMILILVSDLIFILHAFQTKEFRFLLCPSMMGHFRLCGVRVCLSLYVCLLVCLFQVVTG